MLDVLELLTELNTEMSNFLKKAPSLASHQSLKKIQAGLQEAKNLIEQYRGERIKKEKERKD